MSAYKYFIDPWATSGDKVTIPDPPQMDGSVSYSNGFTSDYSIAIGGPGAKAIPRTAFNELNYEITKVLQQYQQIGTPNFITTADNGGTPYAYSKYSYALYDTSDGNGPRIFQSKTDANNNPVTDGANWRWQDGSSTGVIYDNVTFAPGIVSGEAVYWNGTNNRFELAIANGTVSQNVIGFAQVTATSDTTYNRVYGFAEMPFASGLTPGAVYYLSTATPGAITSTLPTTNAIQVGIAKTATILIITTPSPAFVNASTPSQEQTSKNIFGTDIGAVNALVVNVSPAYTSYVAGTRIYVKIANSNTGPTTININSNGASQIYNLNSQALFANDLIAGSIAEIFYNGSNFFLLNAARAFNSITASMHMSANQSLVGTDAVLNFDTVDYDPFSLANTSAHSFTAPITGYYLINMGVYTTSTASNFFTVSVSVNSVKVQQLCSNLVSAQDSVTGSVTLHLTAADVVKIVGNSTSNTVHGSSAPLLTSRFQITCMGS